MSILYINELAPWERKSEYYMHLQLGKDIKSQTEIINKQTKEMISSQIASTNSIISSQERIYDELGNLSYGISGVEHGIYELKAAFEWGISEVVWQFEQNREVLKNILEVLMAPLDTQAKELRKRAEYAYSNAWYEDSLKDFLESEQLNFVEVEYVDFKLMKNMVIEITTTEKIQKKGNSYYILVRKEICEKLGISENDLVEIKIKKINKDTQKS